MAEEYDLSWDRHCEASFKAFLDLRCRQSLVDVTIFCEGQVLKAHKLVLAACSLYFDRVLNHPGVDDLGKAPVVVFPKTELVVVNFALDFMYSGKVTVPSEKFDDFMAFANFLEIRGLQWNSAEEDSPSPVPAPAPPPKKKPPPATQPVRAPSMPKLPLKRPLSSSSSGTTEVVKPKVLKSGIGSGTGTLGVKLAQPQPLPLSLALPTGHEDGSNQDDKGSTPESTVAPVVKSEGAEDDFSDINFSADFQDSSIDFNFEGGEDGEQGFPKNIPPSIVSGGDIEKIGVYCWRGKDLTNSWVYFCDHCGYTSNQSKSGKSDMVRHERKHTGERPYRCDSCGTGFSRKEHLKRHSSGACTKAVMMQLKQVPPTIDEASP